jgi:hypothetical protein
VKEGFLGGKTMNRITWETIPEPTREFLRSITLPPDGAVIEQDGRPWFRLIAYPPQAPSGENADWQPSDNQRRCELIDREIAGTLTPDERLQLEELQQRLQRYVDRVAPLPMEPLRQLHQRLLDRAVREPSE